MTDNRKWLPKQEILITLNRLQFRDPRVILSYVLTFISLYLILFHRICICIGMRSVISLINDWLIDWSETIGRSIKIPTAHPASSTMASKTKTEPRDCDNDGRADMTELAPKTSILPFPVVGRCRNCRGQFLWLCVVENLIFAVGIKFRSCHGSRDIFPVLAAILPFSVIGHCRNHWRQLSSLPRSTMPHLPSEFRRYLSQFQINKYFRFGRPYCYFRLLCAAAVARDSYRRNQCRINHGASGAPAPGPLSSGAS